MNGPTAPAHRIRFRTIALPLALVLGLAALHASPGWALSSRPLATFTGAVANDLLGSSVSSAGDFNADGYPDFMVGADQNDAGGADVGRVYLYYGGPGMDAVADRVFTGLSATERFGYAAASAGDMNGDGYDDLVVGAPYYDAPFVDGGRVFVFLGGPSTDTVVDMTIAGSIGSGDRFGGSVSSAGDVNGDGYDDIVVGAVFADGNGVNSGRAYVYYGSSVLNSVADITITGLAGDQMGADVSGAGDVNRDGYSDVIVGANRDDAPGVDFGRAYVYFGGSAPDNVADWILSGAASGDDYGSEVSHAGDVNGDGYDDVLIGAPSNDTGGSQAGRAHLYFGGIAPDANADVTVTGSASGDFFGAVAAAGDANGDGYADWAAGASAAGSSGEGYVRVYLGGFSPDATTDLSFVGSAAGDLFSNAASVGDVNQDGYDDLLIGARGNDANGNAAGRAYLHSIFPYEILAPNGGEQWVAGHPATVRWRGHDPADVAFSSDGGATWATLQAGAGGSDENEISIVAPGPATNLARIRISYSGQAVKHSTSDVSEGVFRVVLPTTPPAAVAPLRLTANGSAGENLGQSISGAGDVNGDGHPDVIIGAPFSDANGVDAGAVYLLYGGASMDVVPDLTLNGAAAGDLFGFSAASAGDMNRDGYGDLIVGAPANDAGGSESGRAYVFLGGPAPDAVADLILTGGSISDYLGASVASAGDVNGDGRGDVIVGARFQDSGGTDAGRAYVLYGGVPLDAIPDLVLTGAAAFDHFSYSVAGAGDVNRDGYDDVVVGAPNNDAGGSAAGRAYLYHGGLVPDAIADLILTGRAPSDNFGSAVSGGGDVNGDGFADVIVAAPYSDAAGSDAGQGYLFFGGPSPDATADVVATGKSFDQFGTAVSAAGDVNRDGYGDFLMGAPSSDLAGSDTGTGYLFYGGTAPDATPDIVLAVNGTSWLGSALAGVGDVTADGFPDVAVGAYGSSPGGRGYLFDASRFVVSAPNGGETWNVGALKTVSWLGAEPADLWLSTDGGSSYQLLQGGVGGEGVNSLAIRVPHAPSKFARIKLTTADPSVVGADETDSLFTVQTSVALLSMLAAPLPQGGASITWSTDPGPEDLSGYRLERSRDGVTWQNLVSLTRENAVTDPAGGPGTRYRLFAVNGFGEELWLGETSIRPLKPLAAWPLPYRGGDLSISFATAAGLGGAPAIADLSLFDVTGRLVRRIRREPFPAGHQQATWDGRDERGLDVASGVYFLRAESLGQRRVLRLTVLR